MSTRFHSVLVFLLSCAAAFLLPINPVHAQDQQPLPPDPAVRLELVEALPLPLAAAGPLPTEDAARAADADAWPQDAWSKIAYQRFVNNNWEVFLSGSSGSNEVQLTGNSAPDVSPKLNPGATSVIYASSVHSYPSNPVWEIYRVEVATKQVRRLTWDMQFSTDPAWSPDGREIVYTSRRDGNEELYVMNADGVQLRRLTNDPAADREAAWSRSGRIAWIRAAAGAYWLLMMNADGSNFKIIAGPSPFLANPVWNMTGDALAFTADADGNGFADLVLVSLDADGNPGTPVATLDNCQCDYLAGGWYSTGRQFFATRINYKVSNNNLYVTAISLVRMPTDGLRLGLLTVISGSSIAAQPHWNTTDVTAPVLHILRLPEFSLPSSDQRGATLIDDTTGDGVGYRVELLDAGRRLIWADERTIDGVSSCVQDVHECIIYAVGANDLFNKNAKYARIRVWDRMLNTSPWYDMTPDGVTFYFNAHTLDFMDGRGNPVVASVADYNDQVVRVAPQQDTAQSLVYLRRDTVLTTTAGGFAPTSIQTPATLREYGPEGGALFFGLTPQDNRIAGGAFDTPADAAPWQITGEAAVVDAHLQLYGTAECTTSWGGNDCQTTSYAPVTMTQTVTLSPSLTNPTLALQVAFVGYDPRLTRGEFPGASGTLEVRAAGGGIAASQVYTAAVHTHTPYAAWQHAWLDLSPWNGAAVTVTLTYTPVFLFDYLPNRMVALVDNVAVGSWTTPVVTDSTPLHLAVGAGGTLTVTGANLSTQTVLHLGDEPLGALRQVNAQTWVVDVPPQPVPGLYALTLTNPDGATTVVPGAVQVGDATYIPQVSRQWSSFAQPVP